MAVDYLKYAAGNSASTTSSSSISNTDTSLPLTSDSAFGAKSGEGMVIIDEGTANEEYAYATTKSGSALTIPLANRGLEGSSAVGHSSQATVKGILTAAMWNNVIDALTNVVLKTTGALDTTKVVDLATAQALTNKDLSSATNTFPSSLATLAGVQTLTNKKLSDSTTTVVNVTDATKVYKWSLGGATAGKTMTLVSSHTDDRSVTLPDATTTLVGTDTTDALSNKTLTAPKIANGGFIADANGNEEVVFTTTASAVNELTVANAATGGAPQIAATGGDTNIPVDIRGKGTGVVKTGIRYQSDTTSSNQNGVWFQAGWGYFVGDGDTSATEAVTFPTAFTTILGVVATGIGYKDGSNPSGIGDFGDYGSYATINAIATTGFNVALNIPSGTIANTRRIGYTWFAWGI